MKQFIKRFQRRVERGLRLTKREHATIDGVVKRMRRALKKGRGIRLSREELHVLGVYGLQRQITDDPLQPGTIPGEWSDKAHRYDDD